MWSIESKEKEKGLIKSRSNLIGEFFIKETGEDVTSNLWGK